MSDIVPSHILPLFNTYPPFVYNGESIDNMRTLKHHQKAIINNLFSPHTPTELTVEAVLYIACHIHQTDIFTDFLYRIIITIPTWNTKTKAILQATLHSANLPESVQKKILSYWYRGYDEHTLNTLKSLYLDINTVPLPLLWGMDQSHALWQFIKEWDEGLYQRYWQKLKYRRSEKQEYY